MLLILVFLMVQTFTASLITLTYRSRIILIYQTSLLVNLQDYCIVWSIVLVIPSVLLGITTGYINYFNIHIEKDSYQIQVFRYLNQ